MQELSNQRFDVIVVGSGASGGWAAKRLAEAGVNVALLDCGRPQSDQNFTEHLSPFQLKYRDRVPEMIRQTRPIQKDCYACNEFNYQRGDVGGCRGKEHQPTHETEYPRLGDSRDGHCAHGR
jgi:choline dehydrogenase-like flavoprotein